jgi:hypothetical protein
MTRDFYEALAAEECTGEREGRIRNLKAAGLLALCDYAAGREAGKTRDEILGIALVTAAMRYLRRARKKKAKAMRRVSKIL